MSITRKQEMKDPLLSVIIPVYNCAPVITRCLDSIDYPDAEIIVVNDGSTDKSLDVVRDYKKRLKIEDRRLKIIDKSNGGVSSARNRGIEEARGKYISFVDADDYICKGGLSYVLGKAMEYDADVVKFRMKNIEGDSVLRPIENVDTSHVEIKETTGADALMRYDIADHVVWDGIYRRTILIDNGIRFQTDLHLHEDDVFMGMVYCHAEKVICLNLPLYCYVRASNYSSTHHQSIERQRILINSGFLAAQHRSGYVVKHYPQAMSVERLKYMRWVSTPMDAKRAKMTLEEYMAVLNKFREVGVWPLAYKWISSIYYWASIEYKMKCAIKTWMINHPRWSYWALSIRNKT